jgi:ferredoxin-NADP reductase
MAGTAVRGRLTWQTATVATVTDETPAVRTLVLAVPDWGGHRAGQHLDIRLTGDDGYQAERSYSIASAPGEPVAITVERLEDGEVSPYLTQDVVAGDEIEVRGPIGGYFVWDGVAADSVPLLLAAGGSGVVPLRAILRHRCRVGSSVPIRLLYSVRSMAEVIYRSELSAPADGVQVIYTLTRQQPAGWTGYARRVDQAMMTEVAWPESSGASGPLAYVCGPTNFVEAVAADLVALGYPPQRVKTERFGATGTPLLMSGLWRSCDGGAGGRRAGRQRDRRDADRAVRGRDDHGGGYLRLVRDRRAGGRDGRVPGPDGDGGPLPRVRQRAHGVRRGPRGHLRRPAGAGQPGVMCCVIRR